MTSDTGRCLTGLPMKLMLLNSRASMSVSGVVTSGLTTGWKFPWWRSSKIFSSTLCLSSRIEELAPKTKYTVNKVGCCELLVKINILHLLHAGLIGKCEDLFPLEKLYFLKGTPERNMIFPYRINFPSPERLFMMQNDRSYIEDMGL